MIGLANDFIGVIGAKRVCAVSMRTYVLISILRRHLWWCPLHNRFHRLTFWCNGRDPFHELYFFNHELRYCLKEGEGQSDWDFDPFTRYNIRKTLPGIWYQKVRITRWKNSMLAQKEGKRWERRAIYMYPGPFI